MTVPSRCEFRFPPDVAPDQPVLAIVDFHYGDFIIRGFRVMRSNQGSEPWIGAPSKKVGERFVTMAWIPDPLRRKAFDQFVIQQYYRALEERAAAATPHQ